MAVHMKQKRCKSRSVAYPDVRCIKERGHSTSLLNYTHSNGPVFWNEPQGQRAHLSVMDESLPFRISFTTTSGEEHDLTDKVTSVSIGDSDHTPEFVGKPMSQAEADLRGWWFDQATEEIEGTVPKAVEYSATDLADIGHVMARCAGRAVADEEAAELGVFFYLQGKLSRWAGAVAAGERPSDDTIYDIGVYCRMAQRIRATGGWPGTNLEHPIKQQTYGMEPQ